MPQQTEIGAYDAKTCLSAYLSQVANGHRFTITRRGRPIAELVSYGSSGDKAKSAAARQMRAFVRRHRAAIQGDFKSLAEAGRD